MGINIGYGGTKDSMALFGAGWRSGALPAAPRLFHIRPEPAVPAQGMRLMYPPTRARPILEPRGSGGRRYWEQRKPILLLRLPGLLLFRLAVRRLFALLFHEPPRRTNSRFRPIPFQPQSGKQISSQTPCIGVTGMAKPALNRVPHGGEIHFIPAVKSRQPL